MIKIMKERNKRLKITPYIEGRHSDRKPSPQLTNPKPIITGLIASIPAEPKKY